MSDKEDIDFDTLPSKAEDVIDDELDDFDEDEEKGFDDDADELGESDELDDSDDEEEDQEADESEDPEENEEGEEGEEGEEEDEDEDEGDEKKGSILKEALLWGGVGIGVIGGGVYYFDSVLGFNIIGEKPQKREAVSQPKSEIEQLSHENRGLPSSEIIKNRDAERFDINQGWEQDPKKEESKNTSIDKDEEAIPVQPEVTLPSPNNAPKITNERAFQEPVRAAESSVDNDQELIDALKIEVKGVVDEAVRSLLTKKDFENGLSDLSADIEESFSETVEQRESRVMEVLSQLNEAPKAPKREVVDLSGRKRIPNINVLDRSSSGDMSVVRNSSGGTNVLAEGETFTINGSSYQVSGIADSGRVVLVGDKYFIDEKRVDKKISSDNESRSRQEDSATKSTSTVSRSAERAKRIERFRAEKSVADSLKREYSVSLAAREMASRQVSLEHRAPRTNRSSDASMQQDKDYIISTTPIDKERSSDSYAEIPRQKELVVAEGWKGSMIMGNEYLVTDPKGNWRKLRNGERVAELNNNLVHGLDSKNNLIVGNHVILFK